MRRHFEKAVTDDRSVGYELFERRLLRRVILLECGPIGSSYFPLGDIGIDGGLFLFIGAALCASGKRTSGGGQKSDCEYERLQRLAGHLHSSLKEHERKCPHR